MSHEFAFWESDDPLENDQAGEIYRAFVRDGRSERIRPSEKIDSFAREVETLWPAPRPGQEDDWPFASPPDRSDSFLIVCLAPSRLWDVWPTLGEMAKRYELTMYDPQQEHVFLPPRLSRKRSRARSKKKRASDS